MGLFVNHIDLQDKCEKRKECKAKCLNKRKWGIYLQKMHKISNLPPLDHWQVERQYEGPIKRAWPASHSPPHSHFFISHNSHISLSPLFSQAKERKKRKRRRRRRGRRGRHKRGFCTSFYFISSFLFALWLYLDICLT